MAGDNLFEPHLSVVIPVHNEQDNIAPLLKEIDSALQARPAQSAYEIIVVDDCSSDRTLDVLKGCKPAHAHLRIFSHDLRCGQSSAIRTGVLGAAGRLIATLDGDGQNDPNDIVKLLQCYEDELPRAGALLVSGYRRSRRDSFVKSIASRAANKFRRWILSDKAIDSACGLKLFARENFLRLPYFDNMHRYLPALMLREGFAVEFVEVAHRPRLHGKSNYGLWDRLTVSIGDLFGVMWLKRRCSRPDKLSEH